MLDLSLLLSPDNASRNAAEQALEQAQTTHPHQLAQHLTEVLANPNEPPANREMAAVLLRRRLPAMLNSDNKLHQVSEDAIKSRLLACLSVPGEASLRRKVCDAIGRLGNEMHASNSWPELMQWVQSACAAGEPVTHEAALSILAHMAPALVQPASWAAVGPQLQATLIAALGDGGANVAPGVAAAALSGLSELLAACGVEEKRGTATATEKKASKAVAADLQQAVPPMLRALEVAVGSGDGERISDVLSHLSTAAANLPRLFKPVLPMIVDGMAQLATAGAVPAVDADGRIACVELLLTLAEGAPKMVSKHQPFLGRCLSTMLPMLVRLEGELEDWESAEPSDGLLNDEEDDDEKEASYASEALDRLCEALGGELVTKTLLPELQQLLPPSAPWNARHAGLVALATVCEHGPSAIEPHLDSLVDLLLGAATAPEPRLRWAACFCTALLCDEFSSVAEKHHQQLGPLLVHMMGSDTSRRVQAAACLATVNLMGSMAESELTGHAQSILGALHNLLASPTAAASTPSYVAYAACSSLAVLAEGLEEAEGSPMAAAYTAFIPALAQRLGPAVDVRNGKLACQILAAMGNLCAASGAACVASDAPGLVSSVAGLLQRREVADDRELSRSTHTCLTKLAAVAPSALLGCLDGLLPPLLAAAAVEPPFDLKKVEVETPEEDEGLEVQYIQNQGRGMMRIAVNAVQMDEKRTALEALFSYAQALGSAFHPAAATLIDAALAQLSYRWSDKVRMWAASCLVGAYRCLVLAKHEGGVGGIGQAHVSEALNKLLKPLTDVLNKETDLDAADSMLDAVQDIVKLERTHLAGALPAQQAVSGVVQLIKVQLQKDETRIKARKEAEAEREEDEEMDEDEEAEIESENELLATAVSLMGELLVQHGSASGGSAVSVIEAQLLPHISPWLTSAGEDVDVTRLSLGLEALSTLIATAEREHAKKYVSGCLPLLGAHAASDEPRLRRASLYGLGVIAEHGGKLLTRNAAADLGAKLLAWLSSSEAHLSANLEATDAAAAAMGKLLIHRPAAVEAEAALPVWLSHLPLRQNEDDAASAVNSLCKMLEADAAAVLGAGASRFPMVLGAMAAAYESETHGGTAEASARLRGLVKQWQVANGEMLNQTITSGIDKAHLREKLVKMLA